MDMLTTVLIVATIASIISSLGFFVELIQVWLLKALVRDIYGLMVELMLDEDGNINTGQLMSEGIYAMIAAITPGSPTYSEDKALLMGRFISASTRHALASVGQIGLGGGGRRKYPFPR